jgi:hypothetical protein
MSKKSFGGFRIVCCYCNKPSKSMYCSEKCEIKHKKRMEPVKDFEIINPYPWTEQQRKERQIILDKCWKTK